MIKDDLIIDVSGLSKSFGKGKNAVLDVSLKVRKGEIIGFLGPNGCGKTTTIRMLCGLLTPQTGSGHCMGFDIIKQARNIKNNIGYVTQYFSLYKDMTAYENLTFKAKLYGLIGYQNVVQRIISLLGFEQRQHQLARTLSGGWKQRLSLGTALLHGPLLLLLDEPNAGVDPVARRDFWEIVNELSARGITILLSSHNMDEVERCHRISYMNAGKLVMMGTIPEIIARTNLVSWEVVGNNLSLLTKQLEATPGIEQVNPSFDKLHVSARDADALEKAIAPYMQNSNYKWNKTKTNLEDAFIWLNSRVVDTRYEK